MAATSSERSVLIVMPVFNDWEPLGRLLDLIDAVLAGLDLRAKVLLVDDASSERPAANAFRRKFVSLTEIHLLALRRNLGHQRAIAIGLAFANEHLPADMIFIMDSDGQDSPEDFRKLLAKFDELKGQSIIFAERKRRSEGLTFRLFYWLFRITHHLLTGHEAKIGNFSLLPREQLRRLTVVSEIWNNYAAAVYKSRLPFAFVPTDRAKRMAGETRMNFSGLVSHGLSAMSIFNDVIGVRTLSTAVIATLLTAATVAGFGIFHFVEHSTRFDAWIFIGLIVLAMLVTVCAVLATFLLSSLADRSEITFLPMRDYKYYFDSAKRVDA